VPARDGGRLGFDRKGLGAGVGLWIQVLTVVLALVLVPVAVPLPVFVVVPAATRASLFSSLLPASKPGSAIWVALLDPVSSARRFCGAAAVTLGMLVDSDGRRIGGSVSAGFTEGMFGSVVVAAATAPFPGMAGMAGSAPTGVMALPMDTLGLEARGGALASEGAPKPISDAAAIPSGGLMSAYSCSRIFSRSTSSAKVDFMYCIRSLRLKMESEVMRKRCRSSASSLAYW
jgi:hypothetical protein